MDRYYSMKRTELKELAESRGLKKAYAFRKDGLISWLQEQDERNAAKTTSGESTLRSESSPLGDSVTRSESSPHDESATRSKGSTRGKSVSHAETDTSKKTIADKSTATRKTGAKNVAVKEATASEATSEKTTRETAQKKTTRKTTKKKTTARAASAKASSGAQKSKLETATKNASKRATATDNASKRATANDKKSTSTTVDAEKNVPTNAPANAPTNVKPRAKTNVTVTTSADMPTTAPTNAPTDAPTNEETNALTNAPTETLTDTPTIGTSRIPAFDTPASTDPQQEEISSPDGNGKKPRRELPADTGVLEVMSDGYGFLRGEKEDGTRTDYYVPAVQIKRFNLKSGDIIEGIVGDAHDKDKYAPIIYINAVNGTNPTSYVRRMEFDDLTPIYPDERLRLETVPEGISNRIVDLVAPVGRGQRGLIVSPPKAGKTTLLKSIAQAIEVTYPEVYLFILLIDERPEEVTDFEQSVNRMRKADDAIRTEVVASTFDKQAQNHTRTAEELLERAKRLVESGQDVMILLDSLTRLSRAYNITTTPSGRTLSGGLDPVALYPPKKFFGAARNIRDAGSLTILATCLKDTGSRMDDMIYEEFKGTGNMEVHLSRNLSEMRIFPAIDIFSSGTRREDLLLTKEEQNAMVEVRKQGRNADETAVMEQFVRLMKNTETNEEFCRVILGNSAAAASAGRRRTAPVTRRSDSAVREGSTFSRVAASTERREE